MPYSAGENTDFVVEFIKSQGLTDRNHAMIDIGPGAGFYGGLMNGISEARRSAIEIFAPYVDMFNLKSLYDEVVVADARDIGDFTADVVFAGDVLEHMSERDMEILVNRILSQAKWLVISVPIVHYPQGHSHGNAHEEHLQEDINKATLVKLFGEPFSYKEYSTTGTFIYAGVQ